MAEGSRIVNHAWSHGHVLEFKSLLTLKGNYHMKVLWILAHYDDHQCEGLLSTPKTIQYSIYQVFWSVFFFFVYYCALLITLYFALSITSFMISSVRMSFSQSITCVCFKEISSRQLLLIKFAGPSIWPDQSIAVEEWLNWPFSRRPRPAVWNQVSFISMTIAAKDPTQMEVFFSSFN